MTRDEIFEEMKTAIIKKDWYDITHIVKKDDSGYALHLLATIAIRLNEQLDHIRESAKEILK